MSTKTRPSHPPLWIETPLVYSRRLSIIAGCNIFLKLDLLQPSGSFKDRGIGNLILKALESTTIDDNGTKTLHLYASSGGNAGLACAAAGATLNLPVTIVVPLTTPQHMIEKIREWGAEVEQEGENWAAADRFLRYVVMKQDGEDKGKGKVKQIYVPPFDHPDIWEGAGKIVEEIYAQFPPDASPHFQETDDVPEQTIDAILLNVGGGGLLCGVMQGLSSWFEHPTDTRLNKADEKHNVIPKVLAMETAGADSLFQSVQQGECLTLGGITSVATSLGATKVADRAFEVATKGIRMQWVGRPGYEIGGVGEVVCGRVGDREAVEAVVRFVEDERMVVEVACGATLAPVYGGQLRDLLFGGSTTQISREGNGVEGTGARGGGISDEEWATKNVVVVVCGGSNTSLDVINGFRKKFGV